MKIVSLKKSAISNVMGWLLPMIIFIGLTPIMVKELGVEGFGVVTLVQIITGYMSAMNFGFSEAIIKQIAESKGKDEARACRVMWAGLVLFLMVGLTGALALYLSAGWLGGGVLQVQDELRPEVVVSLKISAFIFLLQMLSEFYRGSAIGCKRFDIPNISRILRISISAGLILWALKAGGGIVDVMYATLAGLVAGLVINALWMQRVLPLRKPGGGLRRVMVSLLHFSKHIFFVRITGIIAGRISQFFLGTLSSVANVAWFEVPSRAAQMGAVLLNRVVQVFYPEFSSMDKNRDIGRIRNVTYSVLSLQMLVTTPLLLVALLEGESVIAAWIDSEFATNSSEVISLVAITYYISSFTSLPNYAAMSFGVPGLITKYSAIRLAVTLVFVYPFVKYFGLVGAAWLLLLSEVQAIGFIYETYKRIFSDNIYSVFARQIVIHFALGAALFLGYEYIYKASAWYSPYAVLLIGIVHPTVAALLGATSREDNKRLIRLVTAWR